MKKLPFDSSDWKKIGTINDLIDLVNSQQEAIEKLEKHVDHEARHVSEPADDKPEIKLDPLPDSIGEAFDDTHRTETADKLDDLDKRIDYRLGPIYERLAKLSDQLSKDKTNPFLREPDTHRTEEEIESFGSGELRKERKAKPDTHRTVTLRIPKGMTIGRTILEAMGSSQSSVLSKSDTDLQKALDEVQPNE